MHLTYRLPDFNEYFLCEYKQMQSPVCHRKKRKVEKQSKPCFFFGGGFACASQSERCLYKVHSKCGAFTWSWSSLQSQLALRLFKAKVDDMNVIARDEWARSATWFKGHFGGLGNFVISYCAFCGWANHFLTLFRIWSGVVGVFFINEGHMSIGSNIRFSSDKLKSFLLLKHFIHWNFVHKDWENFLSQIETLNRSL